MIATDSFVCRSMVPGLGCGNACTCVCMHVYICMHVTHARAAVSSSSSSAMTATLPPHTWGMGIWDWVGYRYGVWVWIWIWNLLWVRVWEPDTMGYRNGYGLGTIVHLYGVWVIPLGMDMGPTTGYGLVRV